MINFNMHIGLDLVIVYIPLCVSTMVAEVVSCNGVVYVGGVQVEIDEFQNYEKALGALGEAYKCLSKANMTDANQQELKLNDLKAKMILIKKFLQVKR